MYKLYYHLGIMACTLTNGHPEASVFQLGLWLHYIQNGSNSAFISIVKRYCTVYTTIEYNL